MTYTVSGGALNSAQPQHQQNTVCTVTFLKDNDIVQLFSYSLESQKIIWHSKQSNVLFSWMFLTKSFTFFHVRCLRTGCCRQLTVSALPGSSAHVGSSTIQDWFWQLPSPQSFTACAGQHASLLLLYRNKSIFNANSCVLLSSPLIDIIWAVVTAWKVRGRIIRTAQCCIVYHNFTQYKHKWAVLTGVLGSPGLGPDDLDDCSYQGFLKENLQMHNSTYLPSLPLPFPPLLAGVQAYTPEKFLELEMLVGEFYSILEIKINTVMKHVLKWWLLFSDLCLILTMFSGCCSLYDP